LWQGTVSGSETNLDIVVSLTAGTVSDPTTFGVIIVDAWHSDQSGVVTQTIDFLAGTDLGGGASYGWTFGSTVTPPAADNIVIAAIGRPNRTWTEDGLYTGISVGTNLAFFGYRIQTAATPRNYSLIGDSNGLVSGVLAALQADPVILNSSGLMVTDYSKFPKFPLRKKR
jgi:hypothetical protein